MKIYQVGGAVRDKILHLSPHDIDYVVVGASFEEMRALGFQEVGQGFPVFLHPQTKEEYALARRETKSGDKHTDFKFDFSPDVKLVEDLARRDFTCNAIAFDPETQIYIDPFDGQKDIQNKILRAVNHEHFVEDPLRVLRLCRFAAQLDFKPFPETFELCKKMTASGMLSHLSGERLWGEFLKAMMTPRFYVFIELMSALHALPFKPDERTITALKASAFQTPLVQFAVLLCPVKKLILSFCTRYKTPLRFKNFALRCATSQPKFERIFKMKASNLYDLAASLCIGHVWYVDEFIEVCRAFSQDTSDVFEEKAHFLKTVCSVLQNIKAQNLPAFYTLPQDASLGQKLREFRIKQIDALRVKIKLEK